jgi:hypothetical protein
LFCKKLKGLIKLHILDDDVEEKELSSLHIFDMRKEWFLTLAK